MRRALRPVSLRLVVSCEHAGNEVPRPYADLFRGSARVLESHRGWDPGALELARTIARRLRAPLHFATTTRLLVDLNRSLRHPHLFSEWTRRLPRPARLEIRERYYLPHRERVAGTVASAVREGARVVHLGVHTFAPVLDGEVRRADVGLLYDPARAAERQFCRVWRDALTETASTLRVRRNSPYRGVADGLTTALRRRFGPEVYLGIELEVNQKHAARGGEAWRAVRTLVAASLETALARWNASCTRG